MTVKRRLTAHTTGGRKRERTPRQLLDTERPPRAIGKQDVHLERDRDGGVLNGPDADTLNVLASDPREDQVSRF
jgi:hypothetical protein